MTTSEPLSIRKARRFILIAGVMALLVAAALTLLNPQGFFPAYRYAAFGWLAPALGSLLFLLIHRSTGGQWGESLQPFLSAGVRLAPWIWLLIVPLLWLAPPRGNPGDSPTLQFYLSRAGLVIRAAIYAAAFFFFWWGTAPSSLSPAEIRGARWRGFGPVGLIVITFTLHLLATDWLLSLEPEWYSTAFPLIWMTGQAVFGLSIAILAGAIFGADPTARGTAGRALGLDWGNLMLTGAIFWSYIAFMQFLIIWNGNLPREVIWYVHRAHGLWLGVILGLLAFHFILPFLILLSRKLKQRSTALTIVALSLIVAQAGYLAWMILPAFPQATPLTLLLAGMLLFGGGAILFNLYLGIALGRYPVPFKK